MKPARTIAAANTKFTHYTTWPPAERSGDVVGTARKGIPLTDLADTGPPVRRARENQDICARRSETRTLCRPHDQVPTMLPSTCFERRSAPHCTNLMPSPPAPTFLAGAQSHSQEAVAVGVLLERMASAGEHPGSAGREYDGGAIWFRGWARGVR